MKNRDGRDGLSPKQRTAAVALVETGGSIPAAAERAGVTRRTLERWRAEPAFDREYRSRLSEAFHRATARLQTAAAGAVETLASLTDDENAPPHVRCTAATAILKHARDAIEIDDLRGRIDRLEEIQRNWGRGDAAASG